MHQEGLVVLAVGLAFRVYFCKMRLQEKSPLGVLSNILVAASSPLSFRTIEIDYVLPRGGGSDQLLVAFPE